MSTLMPVKTHIVIPARLKSTRLPNKPLLNIHGKPMILWVAEKAKLADFADDMCIATDDESIAKVCIEAGFDVVMTRSNHASGTDRLAEVAAIKGWAADDIVVNMQGDEPLVPPLLLEQVKTLLVQDAESVMATLCEPIEDYDTFIRPSVVKVVSQNCNDKQQALYFSRAPIPCDRDVVLGNGSNTQAPKNAYRHLGLYAYRVSLLQQFVHWSQTPLEILESLEQLRILENGGKIAIAKAACPLPAGVDTQEDLDRLNAMSMSDF
ncbi:MAG TPA: 3-deoxy-manno-octulosonate cytidylyltransferase [Psychrobacter sp.]|uniref:3-deoxy-manno-octulosonate cytidylyltransferase n=1 Tax=Psychrobacter sp. TaxID=56811 RepID=UPI002CDA503C|nr:3-deoxy-manno-octulosonate cytidylyltransferase [Psychrobacter sp.]HSP86001.1 3-deoxy-manno-octulosonate cytidylyltransferase [Psychrobacter sp.]